MRDLITGFEKNEEAYHRILFEPDEYEVVLAREAAAERSPGILARYRVAADRSPDLQEERTEPRPTGTR